MVLENTEVFHDSEQVDRYTVDRAKDFFDLSKSLNLIISCNKSILDYQATKFFHLVANSPKGIDCTYARICFRSSYENKELIELKNLLSGMKELVEHTERIVSKLEAESIDEQ
ncbi:MAG: hypothetical protein HYS80_00905 [Candidatus Aenigmarchaeota archaeon]|nr:hypothetical protein [Candidatus Aenigmarchaeota archaeon]